MASLLTEDEQAIQYVFTGQRSGMKKTDIWVVRQHRSTVNLNSNPELSMPTVTYAVVHLTS